MKALMTSMLVFICLGLLAQKQVKQKLYTARIVTNKATLSGAILDFSDSTIAMVDIALAKSSIDPSYHEIQVIPVTDIITIKIRRTGAIRRTALTLGVIGGLTGAIIGLAGRPDEDDYNGVVNTLSVANYAVSGAFVGLTIGGAVGAAVGSASKEFPINQQLESFHNHLEKLTKYRYVPDH